MLRYCAKNMVNKVKEQIRYYKRQIKLKIIVYTVHKFLEAEKGYKMSKMCYPPINYKIKTRRGPV